MDYEWILGYYTSLPSCSSIHFVFIFLFLFALHLYASTIDGIIALNDSQYTLCRTLHQEAYLIIDQEWKNFT
jgi:hypothetical protein